MKKFNFYILFFLLFSSCLSEHRTPNFIFIYTDDQRFDTVSSLGNNEIYTPNLDKLASQGTAFSHTYNMGAWHGAICVASRAMIITGKSVWKAKDEIENLSNSDYYSINRTWPKLLSNNGYMTYMSGKWHVNAPIEKIFDIVKNVIQNRILMDVVDEVRNCVKEGDSIAGPLKRSGHFPPIVTHMIGIGEKSGQLEQMLNNVSNSYDTQVDNSMRGLTSLMEPLILVIMGIVIACIVFAILMPILQMSSSI